MENKKTLLINNYEEEGHIVTKNNDEVKIDSTKVIDWLKSTGAKHVVIHFDMDVLDPNEIIAAVGVVPNGIKMDEAARVINDISKEFNLIGLTVAEPVPRTAIKLKNMLNKLPI